MQSVKIISTANAGILIDLGEKKLLIDAFHTEPYDIYPTVTPELFERIKNDPAFSDPDFLIYTHCHPDHFSAEMTEEYARLRPDMLTILPEEKADGLVLKDPVENFSFGDLELSFIRLPHENAVYAEVPHYGVLIRYRDLTVFDPGDCEIASEELIDPLFGKKIDIAVLNFPWLALRRGRKFLKEIIRPAHIAACHLPDPAKDSYGFENNLERIIKKDFADADVRILAHPLQIEAFE